ncbi:MAG: DUF3105 domain-containing protein [Polyangiaceae bacterium]
MSEKRALLTRPTLSLLTALLTAPLLLAHCGATSSDGDAHAGVAGGGTAGAHAGGSNGGTPNSGGKNGDAAGEAGAGGLAGQSAAGAAGADAGAGGELEGVAGTGACGEELLTFSSPSALHVTVCSAISYPMNPPVYGDHYPVWAAYKSYAFPVPLGFLVHNLEHGAVELLYNCPEGCADQVAAAQAFLDALPMDPRCTVEVKHQTILSPDPTLPSRWAAVAWGHSLTADCFDNSAFQRFYDANVGHGAEDICGDGAEITSDTCL